MPPRNLGLDLQNLAHSPARATPAPHMATGSPLGWLLGVGVNALNFDWKELSFLSLSAPIPGLYSVFKLLQQNRRQVWKSFLKIPAFVTEGLYFLATGRTEQQTELERDYFHWQKRRWGISKCVAPSGLLFSYFSTGPRRMIHIHLLSCGLGVLLRKGWDSSR